MSRFALNHKTLSKASYAELSATAGWLKCVEIDVQDDFPEYLFDGRSAAHRDFAGGRLPVRNLQANESALQDMTLAFHESCHAGRTRMRTQGQPCFTKPCSKGAPGTKACSPDTTPGEEK